eukprot:TRINITY_DN10152_c0_g1_i1.p1 TRINITY_DN10152_c0_g1~~TRINITY_DN10152_c0_g1_i1.p1  ORF type:complete len:396 (+),score=105.54 TRINITY_DN10152_c0_g1_i1:66-1253(+)
MPEATIVCVDNSEYMRNGDFNPTRLDAQKDSCNLICGTKLRSSPENSIGLMTMAKRQVIATLTTDLGKILKGMHSIKAEGSIDFLSALAVAQLVLKHRESKTHRQRIVVFVGSPIDAEEAQLVKLGKKLKKSNISVDVISFGEEDANQSKLEAFIHAVNKEESSHLVAVPSGSGVLSDSLLSSPILEGAGGAPGGGPSAGGNDFSEYGGIDPSADPELAMALRISLEEERQRQQREGGGGMDTGDDKPADSAAAPAAPAQPAASSGDAELQAALAMSMAQSADETQPAAPAAPAEPDFSTMTDEEQLQYALSMSMGAGDSTTSTETKDEAESKPEAAAEPEATAPQMEADPAFFSSLLGNLPGVDPNDPQIQAVLQNLQQEADKNQESKDKESKE